MARSFWLNTSLNNDRWEEVEEKKFLEAVSEAGFDQGFFEGKTMSFETTNHLITYKRGKIVEDS
ncbi:MAG: hypothetical protein WCC74_02770 [Minisyncoccia bacterium]